MFGNGGELDETFVPKCRKRDLQGNYVGMDTTTRSQAALLKTTGIFRDRFGLPDVKHTDWPPDSDGLTNDDADTFGDVPQNWRVLVQSGSEEVASVNLVPQNGFIIMNSGPTRTSKPYLSLKTQARRGRLTGKGRNLRFVAD